MLECPEGYAAKDTKSLYTSAAAKFKKNNFMGAIEDYTKAIEQNTRRNQIKKGAYQEKTFLNSTLNFTKALVNQIIDERDSEEDVVSLITGKNN